VLGKGHGLAYAPFAAGDSGNTFLQMRRRRESERGQSLVEFALIVPLLFFLTIGIADFGRVFMTAIGVQSAAREAADYGAFLTHTAWDEANTTQSNNNYAEMARRTCTSLSSLPGYQGTPGNTDCGTGGTPYYAFNIIRPAGVANCGLVLATDQPCVIHARVIFPFSTIVQFPGIPTGITFTRDSYFAVSDF
jgi:Flp pilus assembly protein TadG